MIVAAHPPIFLPWPGLFYKALRADALVLLDDTQLPQGRSWLTRNRLKSDQGEVWLRVPVHKKGRGKQIIRDVEICHDTGWRKKHLESVRHFYLHAPYLDDHFTDLQSAYARAPRRLLDLNLDLLRLLQRGLGLDDRTVLQSDLRAAGRGTDLIISVCKALGAGVYLTLPPAEKYLDAVALEAAGVRVDSAPFEPPVYPQLWGTFRYNLSALDLLLICGPRARGIIEAAG